MRLANMSSKKNKKVKRVDLTQNVEIEPQSNSRKRIAEEVEIVQEEAPFPVPTKKKKKPKVPELSPVTSDEIFEVNHEATDPFVVPTKKKKKLKVPETPPETPEEICEENQETTHSVKKKKKKKVVKDPEEILQNGVNEINDVSSLSDGFSLEEFNVESDVKKESPAIEEKVMPPDDLKELLSRIEKVIPAVDTLSYKCRIDKLDWNDLVFGEYTASDLKASWNHLSKNIRRYRLLKEVLQDAREIVLNPPKIKGKPHPNMPPKPPSVYKIFYTKKRPVILSQMPGLDIGELSRQVSQMFRNLSPEKKAKYEKLANKLKLKYEEQLQVFYENHPELKPEKIKKEKIEVMRKPKNPQTPFALYWESQLRKHPDIDRKDVLAKNSCREKWKNLSLKKKINWITKAEEDIVRYEDEVKKYIESHPNFIPMNIKHILSKEEIALKERFSGKPDKPPNSAYSLFSRIYLQSEEIKKINAKDRMNFIANQWKECSEEEKLEYKNQANELMEQYKKDYEKYINSLPEDKKQIELSKNQPIKKKKIPEKSEKVKTPKVAPVVEKVPQPPTPPMSAFRYFCNTIKLDDKEAKKSWKNLTVEEKEVYEKKLIEVKRQYMLDFERFLNSLSKEELEEYSKTRQELKLNEDFPSESSFSSSSSGEESE